jgi:hypothetical protein
MSLHGAMSQNVLIFKLAAARMRSHSEICAGERSETRVTHNQ